MYNHTKYLKVIPNTGTPIPHITLVKTKEDDASTLSSITCSNNCSNNNSSEIHVTPEKEK